MAFVSHHRNKTQARVASSQGKLVQPSDALPTIWRKRDLVLFIILGMLIATDMRGMQFAGKASFFYWALGLVAFLLPGLGVFGWLTNQAPKHVPFYVWMLRLLNERWRSVVLFLIWWTGVLIVLATLGICVSLLQQAFPSWFGALLVQWLVFSVLLAIITLLTCLSPCLFRRLLWIGAGSILLVLVIPAVAVFVALHSGQSSTPLAAHPTPIVLPKPFSWALFGLTVLNILRFNGPLLLDGEMRGPQRFLRGSTSYLWWGGIGAFLIMLLIVGSWFLQNPTFRILQFPEYQMFGSILGPKGMTLFWLLYFLGDLTCALALLLMFSRAFLLAASQGYLPRSLARLNAAGTPRRAILTQSALIAGTAVVLFGLVPALLQLMLPAVQVQALFSGDQFGLVTSLAGSLWSGLMVILFLFAFWLCGRKRRQARISRFQRLLLSALCLSSGLSSLVCSLAPLLSGWPALFFSHNRWFSLVLLGLGGSLALAWAIGELPRRSALLRAKAQSLAREKALREQLQQSYTRECALHQRLQGAYDEQQILLLRQKVLLDEVSRLYQEQKKVAITDQITGLLRHQAFVDRLKEEIACCYRNGGSFLLAFLDLDHFKAINDTWGHQAGDAVLHEVARRLQNALRPGDVAGRYGGEEFAVMLAGKTLAEGQEEGERLRQLLSSDPCRWQCSGGDARNIYVTVSIGIAAYGVHGGGSEELLEWADQAMYQAKQAGRNCVRLAGEPITFLPPPVQTAHSP